MRFNHIIGQVLRKSRENYTILSSTNGLCRPDSVVGRFSQSVNRYCLQCKQQTMTDNNILKNTYYCGANEFPLCPSWQTTYIGIRGYAKGKDKKKVEKGKKNIRVNDAQLSEIIQVDTLKAQFQKPVDKLKDDYFRNLSLRSTTGTIETLKVSLEGKDYILQELAQVVRKDAKTVVINMAVFPQAIPVVVQAIQRSGMNLNPQQDGTTLFIPIPKVTKEHRENLSKNAKVLFIKCRDCIKDVQNKFIKSVKSKDTISKDDAHDAQEQITSLADQYIATAEAILSEKQAELTGN